MILEVAPDRLPGSLNECLAANQVLEVLVAFIVLPLFLDRFGHNISQLSSVEERSSVLENIIGPIIQELSDEKTDESHEFRVLPEVEFILYA